MGKHDLDFAELIAENRAMVLALRNVLINNELITDNEFTEIYTKIKEEGKKWAEK